MTKATTMQNGIIIPEGTLVVLSGLSGSGKSSLRERALNVGKAIWVSSDEIRDTITPPAWRIIQGKVRLVRNETANIAVFAIMRERVRASLQMGRTVVVDATNLTDADRKEWVDIATAEGMPHLVVILDPPLEECLARAAARPVYVGEHTIRKQHQLPAPTVNSKGEQLTNATAPEGFDRSSKFKHVVLTDIGSIVFTPNELPEGKYQVIGDTHALFDDVIELLEKAGWTIENGRLLPHPDGYILLFLGDLVDRGTKSVELVRFVKRAVEDGLALAIKGNHEVKLVRFVRTAMATGIERWTSYANAETGMAFLRLDPVERDSLISFLHNLPSYYLDPVSKTVFLHADVYTFEPGITLKEECLFGMSGWEKVDSDGIYQQGVAEGINQYTVVRGHFPATSEQSHIFSLERHPFQKGELVLMQFDQVRSVFGNPVATADERKQAFARSLITHKCEFDFAEYSKRYDLAKGLEKLIEEKLVTRNFDDDKMLRVYKYSKRTFYDNAWGESQLLLKARGLVLDPSGAIVSHPFDKCFNYLENGTGKDFSDDMEVVEVEKLNGFLGIISAHPLKKNELLVHTQGGFGGPFVDYIKSFITPQVKGQLLKYLSRNNVTLMFEVLHPEDPHIVQYPPEMMGLHLLGVRGKGQTDQPLREDEVDEAAREMGLRRPKWRITTFGEVRKAVRETRTEGVMVRANTLLQEFLLKMKSPHYLTVKFLGRLSAGKIKHMYANPRDFKKTQEEESYIIVDVVVSRFTLAEFIAFDDTTRVSKIHDIINELQ